MHIEVTRDVVNAMEAAARAAHPKEACGILLGDDQGGRNRITQFVETRNVHPSPETHFEIDPQALIAAHRDARGGGPQVLGYFHSHPTGFVAPSQEDRARAAQDGKIWAIFARDEFGWWLDHKDGFAEIEHKIQPKPELALSAILPLVLGGVVWMVWNGEVEPSLPGTAKIAFATVVLAAGGVLVGALRKIGFSLKRAVQSQLIGAGFVVFYIAELAYIAGSKTGEGFLLFLGVVSAGLLLLSGFALVVAGGFYLNRFQRGSIAFGSETFEVVDE